MDRKLRKELFLKVYSEIGTVLHTCTCLWFSPNTIYKWVEEDVDFASGIDDAHKIFVDKLEKVAYSRALYGKSDTLLIFLLKGNKPSRYSEKVAIDHSGKVSTFLTSPADLVQIANVISNSSNNKIGSS